MTDSVPTLPQPMLIKEQNYIPPPPISLFDSVFSGYLPPGTSLPSSWGVTRYYDFAPNSPSKRRIILLHGGGTCAIGMAPLAFELTEAGNHVVIYDLWGHGLSSTPLETHTAALLHAQLLELLVHLGWEKVHVLGFSMGGSIAVSFAAQYPAIVESGVIVGGAGLWKKSERGWWDAVVEDGGWGREGMSQRKIMAFVHAGGEVKPDWKERLLKGDIDVSPVQKWERENHGGHVASLVSMWRYVGVFDLHEQYRTLAKGSIPMLVVFGEKDTVIEPEKTQKELLEMGWKGEFRIIEGATHEIVRTHAREVAKLASAFWGGL